MILNLVPDPSNPKVSSGIHNVYRLVHNAPLVKYFQNRFTNLQFFVSFDPKKIVDEVYSGSGTLHFPSKLGNDLRIVLGKEFHTLHYVQQQEIVIGHLDKFFNDFNLRRVENPMRVYITTIKVLYTDTSIITCDVKIVE